MKNSYPHNPNDDLNVVDYFQTRLDEVANLLTAVQKDLAQFGSKARLDREMEEHLNEIEGTFTARWDAVRERLANVVDAVTRVKHYSEAVRENPKGHQTTWTTDDNGYTFAYAQFPSTLKNLAKRLLGKQQDFNVVYSFTFTNKEFRDHILNAARPDTPSEESPKVPSEAREDLSKHFNAVSAADVSADAEADKHKA